MNLSGRFGRWKPTQWERLLVFVGSVVVLGLLGHFLVLVPLHEEMRRLDRAIAQKEEDLKALLVVRHEYRHLRRDLEQIESRVGAARGQTALLARIEDLAARLQLRDRVAYMRPQAETVVEGYKEVSAEVKVEGVRLEEALGFLTAIENAPSLLRVRQFHLKARFSDPGVFDMTLMLATYEAVPRPGEVDRGA